MKPVLSLAWTTVLPSFSPTSKPSLQRLVGGRHRLHDLEQRHHLRRVEEVQAEEAVGPRRRRGLIDHRERGGVGGEEGVLLDDRVDLAPHLELALEVLGHRLDHEVAVGELAVVGRLVDPAADVVGVRLLHPALLDRAAELLLDLAEALASASRRRPRAGPRPSPPGRRSARSRGPSGRRRLLLPC